MKKESSFYVFDDDDDGLEDEAKPPSEDAIVFKILSLVKPLELMSLCRALALKVTSMSSRGVLLRAVLEQLKMCGSPVNALRVLMPDWMRSLQSLKWNGKPIPEQLLFLREPSPVLSLSRRSMADISMDWDSVPRPRIPAPTSVLKVVRPVKSTSPSHVAQPDPKRLRLSAEKPLQEAHSKTFEAFVLEKCGGNAEFAAKILQASKPGATDIDFQVCMRCEALFKHDTADCNMAQVSLVESAVENPQEHQPEKEIDVAIVKKEPMDEEDELVLLPFNP